MASTTGSGMAMWRMMGPALLFAGTAIGTSHLVQSTRAGAMYGLSLFAVILLACVLRYPAFRFGVDYGHATGRSMMVGYRARGMWAPLVFAAVALLIGPIIFAALAAATGGIMITVLGLESSVTVVGLACMAVVAVVLLGGGYEWLDKVNRVLVAFLVVSTLATTIMVLPRVEWATVLDISWAFDPKAILFVVALAGFMPNALDVSMTQSMWTAEAEQRADGDTVVTLEETRQVFLTGYSVTALLALCFCIMGAGVMHSEGIAPVSDAPGFAGQIVGLYSATLGETGALLAAIAAMSAMLSTLLAAFDVGGRNVATTWQETFGQSGARAFNQAYRVFVPLLVLVSGLVLYFFTSSFTAMLDLATSASFIAAPVLATLNHLAVTGKTMPEEAQPSRAMRALNLAAIAIMAGLAVTYFVLR